MYKNKGIRGNLIYSVKIEIRFLVICVFYFWLKFFYILIYLLEYYLIKLFYLKDKWIWVWVVMLFLGVKKVLNGICFNNFFVFLIYLNIKLNYLILDFCC